MPPTATRSPPRAIPDGAGLGVNLTRWPVEGGTNWGYSSPRQQGDIICDCGADTRKPRSTTRRTRATEWLMSGAVPEWRSDAPSVASPRVRAGLLSRPAMATAFAPRTRQTHVAKARRAFDRSSEYRPHSSNTPLRRGESGRPAQAFDEGASPHEPAGLQAVVACAIQRRANPAARVRRPVCGCASESKTTPTRCAVSPAAR